VRFWPSLAVHSSAANAPIGIILGNAIEGAGLYKAAKLQAYRLKIHAASNGLTFEKFQNLTNSTLGHVWLAISRPSIQIFQLFFGSPYLLRKSTKTPKIKGARGKTPRPQTIKLATLRDVAQSVYRAIGPHLPRNIWVVSIDIPAIFR